MQPYYERIPHTADLAVRVWAPTLPVLFANAGRALFAMMADPPADESVTRRIVLESVDLEALLVDWLNELIYRHEVDGETYARFEVLDITDTNLEVLAHGGPTTRRVKNIKAATFHDLRIARTPEGFEARIVFDV